MAYGSDVERVRDILVDVANQHPEVITDGTAPAPRALFMEFGDSSLNFELRVRIKRIERRYTVMSDLNFAIDAALREENITIPFPQRDLHIISTPDKPEPEPVPEPQRKRRPKIEQRDITRRQKHEIEIEAALEDVWQALTDEAMAERWLAKNVDMKARIGGDVRLGFDNDTVLSGRIDMFMPPRRLRIVLQPPEGDAPLASGPITEEIVLSEHDSTVTMKVTVRGIPATEDWEQYYRRSEDRWTAALKDLKRVLGDSTRPPSS